MRPFNTYLLLLCLLCCSESHAQLEITRSNNADALAQFLVGEGITIFSATIKGTFEQSGFFYNRSGTLLGLDSGIVLTSGKAKSNSGTGLAGPQSFTSSHNLNQPGDLDLSEVINATATKDANVLEFDFVPQGNVVRFRYIFSSEEYPEYNCTDFNDVFAFFISGPGFPFPQNIAKIPGTNIPVSINSVNSGIPGPGGNIANCQSPGPGAPFVMFYISNLNNTQFTHDGHTTVFETFAIVQPCATYHLKLAIADAIDYVFDSAVFLEAKSLSAPALTATPVFPTDNGKSFLAEGCNAGSFTINTPYLLPAPQAVNLFFAGTAINGVDVGAIPAQVVIPPNQPSISVPITVLTDNLAEGVELLKIYISPAGCAGASIYTDSVLVEIRDYNKLFIIPEDSAGVCKNTSLSLIASTGYASYQWEPNPTLSSFTISNPVASPVNNRTMYRCRAVQGACIAVDSVLLKLKDIELLQKTDNLCASAPTGSIKTAAGWEWKRPLQFSLNSGNWQTDSSFHELPAGTYIIHLRDAAQCADSLQVTILQPYPALTLQEQIIPANCTGQGGQLTINASGGLSPYRYSVNPVNYSSTQLYTLATGNHTLYVKDENNCIATKNIFMPMNNPTVLLMGPDKTICAGETVQLLNVSDATSFRWTPTGTLSNPLALNPIAAPLTTTKYYITAYDSICQKTDSVIVFVKPAPIAGAGNDSAICLGNTLRLNGSGGINYTWSPATYLDDVHSPQPVCRPEKNIVYRLTVTDSQGCSSRAQVRVLIKPPVPVNAGEDVYATLGQTVQLRAEGPTAPPAIYSWEPATGLSNTTIPNPLAATAQSILYKVMVTMPDGCTGTDEIWVKIYLGPEIYVPGAFTPNNDGVNDKLFVIAAGIKKFHFFRIYNRWGQLVFFTNNLNTGWDGTIRGTQQPSEAYTWHALATDYTGKPLERKGTVVLIR
jgi:gliding motility-associated-like protein